MGRMRALFLLFWVPFFMPEHVGMHATMISHPGGRSGRCAASGQSGWDPVRKAMETCGLVDHRERGGFVLVPRSIICSVVVLGRIGGR